MATDGPDPKPCDKVVFKHGKCIAVFLGSSNAIENVVRLIGRKTGCKVDWHYSGGRARILCLGNDTDYEKVDDTIEALTPEEWGTVTNA